MNKLQFTANIMNQLDTPNGLVVKIVASRAVGKTIDANNQEFDLSPECLQLLVDNYNRRVHDEYQETIVEKKRVPLAKKLLEHLLGKPRERFTIDDIALLPVQTEHEMHVKNTIGTVMGLLSIGEWDNKDAVFANLLISDEDAIKRIDSGRLHQVSMSFSYPDMILDEISFTVYGAVEKTNIIAIQENGSFAYSKPREVTMNNNAIKKIQLKLKEIESTRIDLKKQKENLLFQITNKNIVLSLVKRGKIYAKFKECITNDFNTFSSAHDRDIALKIFCAMPNIINEPRNLNTLAIKTEELLASDDLKEKAVSFSNDFYSNVATQEQIRIDLSKSKKLKDADFSLEKMEKHIHGNEHETSFKERMQHHAKMGTHKEGFEEYCKFNDIDMSESSTVDESPNEVKQVPMSKWEEEEHKKAKEDVKKIEKKDADLSKESSKLLEKLRILVEEYRD